MAAGLQVPLLTVSTCPCAALPVSTGAALVTGCPLTSGPTETASNTYWLMNDHESVA